MTIRQPRRRAVDSKPNWGKQAGLTPGKMALMVVLAVVFVGVLYHQFGGRSTPPQSVTVQSTSPADSATTEEKPSTKQSPSAQAVGIAHKKITFRAQWQALSLATVVGYDPFALPTSFPQPPTEDAAGALAQNEASSREDLLAQRAALAAEREQTQSQLAGLRQQGVQIFIKRNNQQVATVGDQEVHVGDKIDGFTVIAIDADGDVHVAKDLSQ